MDSPQPIHLFANLAYGSSFLATAVSDARRTGRRWTVVISTRRGSGAPPSLADRLRDEWRRLRLAMRLRVRVVNIADVNAPAFIDALPHGSLGVVAGFNQIFRPHAIERFASLVNFHPSLLPYYRGPTPSHWVLARGEPASGFTLHRVEARIDAGESLTQEVVSTQGVRSAAELDLAIAVRAQAVFARWIAHLDSGDAWARSLVDAGAVYRDPADYLSFPS